MLKSRAYSRQPTQAKITVKKSHFLREWRERKTDKFPEGMSQEIVAERSGLSVSSISAYESGKNNPSLDALQKLSHAIGVPRGMLTDIDPNADPQLWDAYLRADDTQRAALGRMAAGLIDSPSKRQR